MLMYQGCLSLSLFFFFSFAFVLGFTLEQYLHEGFQLKFKVSVFHQVLVQTYTRLVIYYGWAAAAAQWRTPWSPCWMCRNREKLWTLHKEASNFRAVHFKKCWSLKDAKLFSEKILLSISVVYFRKLKVKPKLSGKIIAGPGKSRFSGLTPQVQCSSLNLIFL